jgi:hypothetical protein
MDSNQKAAATAALVVARIAAIKVGTIIIAA